MPILLESVDLFDKFMSSIGFLKDSLSKESFLVGEIQWFLYMG